MQTGMHLLDEVQPLQRLLMRRSASTDSAGSRERFREIVELLIHINNPSRQRRALQEKLAPMLGYLNKLRHRMQNRGFPHDDPL
jgi:hypothetical protein